MSERSEFHPGATPEDETVLAEARYAEGALSLVHVAISQMLHLEDPGIASAACSFCGRPRSEEVEFGAGPNAYICAECVELFHQILKPKPPKA